VVQSRSALGDDPTLPGIEARSRSQSAGHVSLYAFISLVLYVGAVGSCH
jgi:hypothetical protein